MATANTVFGDRHNSNRVEPKSPNYLSTSDPAVSSALPHLNPASESDQSVRRGEQPRNKLVVGPNIKMKGVEVEDCDSVMVEGQIEAILDSRLVHVAQAGVFTGTVSVDVAEIWGCFEGELTVRKQLIIHPSGRVNGRICYAKIEVEEGGQISGDISSAAQRAEKVEPLRISTAVKRIAPDNEKNKSTKRRS